MIDLLDEGINLLIADDALSRIYSLSAIVGSVEDGRVIYMDLDTVFTAYIMHGIIKSKGMRIDIFIPDRGRFEDLLAGICSSIADDTRLVVLDSIHGFYHLYQGVRVLMLNHLLTSYISMLAMHVERYSVPLLVTSIRKTKIAGEQVDPGTKAYSSRYLWSRSSTVLSARYSSRDNRLVVQVMKHLIDTLRNAVLDLSVDPLREC